MEPLRIDNLFARRSIRAYTDEPVSDAQVELLLKAAMAAPTANNRQPWHFVVVRDPATRKALADSHPYAKMLVQSPVCIIPCGEPPGPSEFWVQDLAAATENILLAAVGIGLGTVWCGVYPSAERVAAVRQILGLPDHIKPFCFIAVGHRGEEKEARTQFNPAKVHQERW